MSYQSGYVAELCRTEKLAHNSIVSNRTVARKFHSPLAQLLAVDSE